MRVKVAYTTQYQKVPKLVNNILKECGTRLTKHSELEFPSSELESFLSDIEKAREDLSLTLMQLEDCANLATGYSQAQDPKSSVPQPEPLFDDVFEED